MLIGIPKEVTLGEHRVALIPERVKVLVASGQQVMVETGAGLAAGFDDQAYLAAGAEIASSAKSLLAQSELVVKVRAPVVNPDTGQDEIELLKEGSILVALLDPLNSFSRIHRLAEQRVTAFSLDAIPRITRAQSMDVLSSMATVAGYKAAVLAAANVGKLFPLLMTAAGTITPSKVLVLGAGVAGLQAIATAKRLGAVIQAFDTRPAVREQVESLGASFLTLPLKVENAQDEGGYARELHEDAYQAERDLLAEPVRLADVVITTAAIPGARAPILITAAMVASMRQGTVIVDLSAATGGNCELSVPDEQVHAHGVLILAPTNLAATVPIHASQLFSRNAAAFVTHLLAHGFKASAESKVLELSLDDEILRATCVSHAGSMLHSAAKERWEALQGGADLHEQHAGV